MRYQKSTYKQRLSHQLIRPRRHHVAEQQDRAGHQARRHRGQRSGERLANVRCVRQSVLDEQRLAQRAEHHFDQLQQTGLGRQEAHVDAGADATAANANAAIALVMVVVDNVPVRVVARTAGRQTDGRSHM